MKLWFAFMFEKEDSSENQEAAFLVRAPDPVICTKLVESCKEVLPEHIDPFVTGIIEMGDEPLSEEPKLLTGPLLGCIDYETDDRNTYWRRDSPDEYWVNFTKFYQGAPMSECIFEGEEEVSLIQIVSEDDVLKAAQNILDGQFDGDLDALGDQLDLCIEYLERNGLLEQYEDNKSHPFTKAIDYLTEQLIKKAHVICNGLENTQ